MSNVGKLYDDLQRAIEAEGGQVPCQAYPDLFFPETHDNGGSKDYAPQSAKKLCRSCPVIWECGEYALEAREDFGVWGGMSAIERKKLNVRKPRR
jgi:WhiB family redox-sensing transcriptional regulator